MPAGVGYVNDKTGPHDEIVREIIVWEEAIFKQLTPIYNAMARFNKLYLGDRKDRRGKNEQWRSFSWLGEPFALEETKTAALCEIMNAVDPPWQTEGVGREDEPRARGFLRTLDYVFRGNRWPYTQEMLYRTMGIQGWVVLKTGWREDVWKTTQRPGLEQRKAFDMAANEAMKQGMPSPPDPESSPDEFAQWMDGAKRLYPTMPTLDLREIETIQYRGPSFTRLNEFDLRFDPFVEDWTQQKRVLHRILKPWSWVEQKVKEGIFDEKQVASAKSALGSGDVTLSKWDKDIASAIGLTYDDADPMYRDHHEFFEVWEPQDKFPYKVIMNRRAIVNVRPDMHPYWHRQLPFIPFRNIPLGHRAIGQSDYAQIERTIGDRVTFRDLLMDAMILSVMPVFLKGRTAGLPDAMRSIFPGLVVEMSDVNAWKRGWEAPAGFAELVKIGEMLRGDEDDVLATWGNVRGAQAPFGRVSATESQSRLNQAQVRQKQQAIRLEEEHNPLIPQALMNIYQKWPEDDPEMAFLAQKIAGDDEPNPFVGMTRDTFVEALEMDIKFRGASRTLNKELLAQQLSDFLGRAVQIQVAPGVSALTPSEIRNTLRRIVETLGLKGISEIITAEGDALQDEAFKLVQTTLAVQSVSAQQQLQMALNPPQIDPNTGQPVAAPAQPAQEGAPVA